METNQEIRTATSSDLDCVAAVEAECFPAAEAASKEEFAERIAAYGNHFWLLFENGKLVSFVDGMVTDTPDLADEMYENAALHDENGAWQMIFGVNTIPECRKKGYAGQLIRCAIEQAKKRRAQRACLDLQGQTAPLLWGLWLCQRGRFGISTRQCCLVSDAPDVIKI